MAKLRPVLLGLGTVGLLTVGAALPAAADTEGAEESDSVFERPVSENTDEDSAAAQDSQPVVAYGVTLVGVEDGDLKDLMERSMLLNTLADQPPATLPGLARRIEGDAERLRTVMHSEGYWDGTVEWKADDKVRPVEITMTVTLGQRYRFQSYDIRFVGEASTPDVPTPAELGLTLDAPARGEDIVSAGRQLMRYLGNHGRPLARQVDRIITVDHRDEAVSVEVVIDPGPSARFGPVTFTGLDRTSEEYVRQWITWAPGDPYVQSELDSFRSGLLETGLFGSVVIITPETLDADGELPITAELNESEARTVGFGVGYSTDRGAGGRVFWRHRNLLGQDEDLELSLRGDFLEQEVRAEFERPNFGEIDRALLLSADAKRSDTDAYKGFEANAAGAVRWKPSERWTLSAGGSVNYSDLDDVEGPRQSLLVGIPLTAKYDGHDNDLNPTEGARFLITNTPYAGEADQPIVFNTAVGTVAAYYALDEEKRYILAGRTRLGSIVGENVTNIPANKRFYAGGGGSIRGYGYQLVGPLDANNDPVGGRSVIEFSAEVRMRVWGDIGVVPFIDGGNVYFDSFPSFEDPLQWGGGIGLRYHTAAGPLRFDVAFPINRRSGVDDPFQIYISLGQAF